MSKFLLSLFDRILSTSRFVILLNANGSSVEISFWLIMVIKLIKLAKMGFHWNLKWSLIRLPSIFDLHNKKNQKCSPHEILPKYGRAARLELKLDNLKPHGKADLLLTKLIYAILCKFSNSPKNVPKIKFPKCDFFEQTWVFFYF